METLNCISDRNWLKKSHEKQSLNFKVHLEFKGYNGKIQDLVTDLKESGKLES